MKFDPLRMVMTTVCTLLGSAVTLGMVKWSTGRATAGLLGDCYCPL